MFYNSYLIYRILENEDGTIYEGNYVDNSCNGFGKETYPDGSIYEGNWVDDEKSGKGIYYYADGNKYEGNHEDNLRWGYGIYTKEFNLN